jgi:hypothetical protein
MNSCHVYLPGSKWGCELMSFHVLPRVGDIIKLAAHQRDHGDVVGEFKVIAVVHIPYSVRSGGSIDIYTDYASRTP